MLRVIITSILLGIGLAMDACVVSMANGFRYPKITIKKILLIAIMFGLFQGLMPFIGYSLGSLFLSRIEEIIPFLSLFLLSIVGVRMLYEGIKNKEDEENYSSDLTLQVLLIQALATSIDALSIGFTISNYSLFEALICVILIAIITFIICVGAVFVGKKFGTKLGNKASILGGVILIGIGIEIFINGLFF